MILVRVFTVSNNFSYILRKITSNFRLVFVMELNFRYSLLFQDFPFGQISRPRTSIQICLVSLYFHYSVYKTLPLVPIATWLCLIHPLRPFSLISILILSYCLPACLSTKIFYAFVSAMHSTCSVHNVVSYKYNIRDF